VRWSLSPSEWLRIACATAGRDLTIDEWRRYTGVSAPSEPVCGR
jgi:hypothetical protein